MVKKYIIALVVVFSLSLNLVVQKIYDVKKYGAKGDSITNDAVTIQEAIDACSKRGGRVIIPAPFTFLTGHLT